VKFKAPAMIMTMKITVLLNVTPCSLLET